MIAVRSVIVAGVSAVMLSVGAWAQAVSRPAVARIPAGEFQMGSEKGAPWERPLHRVSVGSFEIGARPVTNGQYRAFRPSHHSRSDDADGAPVTGVSWQDAHDYCEWLSAKTRERWQLPTEALWARAIRGGLEQKDYPWGDDSPIPAGQTAADGAKPQPRANAYGVYAVTDNLWEWVADWYAPDYYRDSPTINPTGPEQGVYKVLRGGGYRNDPNSVRTYNRGSARVETRSDRITFRAARVSGPGAPPPPPRVTESRPPRPPSTPRQTPVVAASPPRTPSRPAPKAAAPKPAPKAPPKRAAAPPKPRPAPAAPAPAGAVDVRSLDVKATGSGVEIVFGTSARAAVKGFPLKNPPRYVADIQGGRSRLGRKFGSKTVGQGGVAKVRWAQNQPDLLRIVIDLDAPLTGSAEARADSVVIRLSP